MTNDKQASWADHILAESDLPSDDFTWTEGSNYGLDGFHHDQTLGEGVKNHGDQSGMAGDITPAQTSGMSDLPDGFVKPAATEESALNLPDFDDGVDLSEMLSVEEGALHLTAAEREAASLADLNWLDPTQEQDPDRLPKDLRPDKAPLNSIPELEEAWGVNRRTDGLALVPNKDKEIAEYEAAIESGLPATPGVEKNASDLAWHIKKAIRLSHYGQPIGAINVQLHQALGDTPLFHRAFGEIAANHGLAGNVYVQASAFPGVKNGKWVQQIKKACRTAQYVITDDPLVAAKLGMQMVSEVPWKRAYTEYKPRLSAAGYKVANHADPKKALQRAFLRGPEAASPRVAAKPVEVQPADRVSLDEARAAFATAPKQERQIVTRDATGQARKKVLARLRKAVAAGLLSDEDGMRLAQSAANPTEIQRAAESLARINLAAKSGTYTGVGTQVTAHRQGLRDAEWAKLAQAEVDAAQMKRAYEHVSKMAQAGQITAKEAWRATAEKTPQMVLKVATAFANAAGLRKPKMASAKPAKEYDGPVLTAALQSGPQTKKLAAEDEMFRVAAQASGIKVAEFKALATWLRRQMSEGMAGNDLTGLMTLRFASPLREAAEQIIANLREEHEGLSGHLYVDAAAYASPQGTKGCEKAASKHRANQVPAVKAMERCRGCVFANANNVCTKYGKELMYQLPKDAASFKRMMLQTADAPDHEITASLFDPGEYHLGSSLDHIDLEEPAVTESIDGVFFGDGMTW